jgi:hypothetical protein
VTSHSRPNLLWLVNFNYFAKWFTAFVSDVCSRRIVKWRTAAGMPTELPPDGRWRCGPAPAQGDPNGREHSLH